LVVGEVLIFAVSVTPFNIVGFAEVTEMFVIEGQRSGLRDSSCCNRD
jgi:hypothetical protein